MVAMSLDRESEDSYVLTVIARDQGDGVPRNATVSFIGWREGGEEGGRGRGRGRDELMGTKTVKLSYHFQYLFHIQPCHR